MQARFERAAHVAGGPLGAGCPPMEKVLKKTGLDVDIAA